MEFSIEREALEQELSLIQGVVEKRSTVPVLSKLLIESMGEGRVRLTGTDLEITLRCEVEAQVTSAGSMCVPARKLFEIVRLLPESMVSFRKEENEWVTIECGRSHFRLAGESSDHFPEVPALKPTVIRMASGVLKTLIERTVFAITEEESRYTLSGAKFIVGEKGARMVATDGHRLAFIEHQGRLVKEGKDRVDVLVPGKALAALSRLTATDAGDLGLGADAHHVYFEVGGRQLISRLLGGRFADYEKVMPGEGGWEVLIDGEGLRQAIERVSIMTERSSRAIHLEVRPGVLELSSRTAEEGEARESLAVGYVGDRFEVAFNGRYLEEMLRVVGEVVVRFEYRDANSQVQMRVVEEGGYDYRYIVMPMRP